MSTSTPSPPKKQINLLRGWPSPSLLPAPLLSTATQRILSSPATSVPLLQYAPDEGYQPLRERLAEWLAGHYGVEPDADRICITGGASQNLACVLQSFTDPGWTRAVWMVAPCYHLAGAIFEDAGFGGRLRAVPEDEEGVDVGELGRMLEEWEREEEEKGIRPERFKDPGPFRKLYRHIIYAVPTCSNPSGKTMSLHHRQALVRIARKHDALIISDDVYDFLQWPLSGDPPTPHRPPAMRLPRLCDVDMAMGRADNDPRGFGHAVSNGSFSKIAGPGVRTGWAEGTPAFVLGLSKTGSSMSGGAPSGLCAGMMADLLESGELVDFIETRTRPALQRRHRVMMDAVKEYLGPLGVVAREEGVKGEGVYGGYFVWLELTRGPAAVILSDAALEEENVVVGRGGMFAVKGDERGPRFDDNIRLCFSWVPEEDLVEGVKRLGELIGRMQGNMEHYERLAAQVKDSDRPVSSWV